MKSQCIFERVLCPCESPKQITSINPIDWWWFAFFPEGILWLPSMSSSCNHQGCFQVILSMVLDQWIWISLSIYSHTAKVSMVYVPTFDCFFLQGNSMPIYQSHGYKFKWWDSIHFLYLLTKYSRWLKSCSNMVIICKYPIICRVLAPSQVVCRTFWTINSITYQANLAISPPQNH